MQEEKTFPTNLTCSVQEWNFPKLYEILYIAYNICIIHYTFSKSTIYIYIFGMKAKKANSIPKNSNLSNYP